MTWDTLLSIFLGIGLAASVGFRVFLPLFALSLAAYAGLWPLNAQWQWLGSLPAVMALGVAMLAEIGAYFVPWVDHILDTIALPLAALAGTAIMVATATNMDPLVTWSLAIIAGGGTATAIKSASATGRLAATGVTGGMANPIISGVETGTALVVSTASIFAPVLAAILVLFIFFALAWIYKKVQKKT
ncbi:DUF4126 domain-containing protein [Arenibacter sp. GZD96]|uniref:DUF4126 domain-containing protein n=1 Tax=Aurantibrevibacter litoralis TaxID=3106030 RepID=UPI002AFF7F52|nr:DUF4126 domain-containing protein [Arenibacter sp. GZD-96]MEA1784913.1 DUF4126 domain-containing protein [Arenibacter sp. GZD-96]